MNDETEFGNKAPDGDQLAGESDSAESGMRPEDVGRAFGVPMSMIDGRPWVATADEQPDAPAWCGLEKPHGQHGEGAMSCAGWEAPAAEDDGLGTYADMFAEYLAGQKHWIGAAHRPLVFHIRKLCQKLDADPNAAASYASAYLQAVSRLDRQRPGNAAAGVAGDPAGAGQRSIFDELD